MLRLCFRVDCTLLKDYCHIAHAFLAEYMRHSPAAEKGCGRVRIYRYPTPHRQESGLEYPPATGTSLHGMVYEL